MNTPYNEVLTSYNVLIRDNDHSTCLVLEWKACFFIKIRCRFIPKIPGKMSHTPVKNTPTWNKIQLNNLTWRLSLKRSLTLDWFQSGPGNSGFWVSLFNHPHLSLDLHPCSRILTCLNLPDWDGFQVDWSIACTRAFSSASDINSGWTNTPGNSTALPVCWHITPSSYTATRKWKIW